ncbi:MAG: hypothetical protein OWV35_12765 [Firmicutes bacterium]|nr:hypothetical protein [Bacillota bacterium]
MVIVVLWWIFLIGWLGLAGLTVWSDPALRRRGTQVLAARRRRVAAVRVRRIPARR